MQEVKSQQLTNSNDSLLRELLRIGRGCLTRLRNSWRYHQCVTQQQFPKQIRQILIGCTGNICRSPLAEAYLNNTLWGQANTIIVKGGMAHLYRLLRLYPDIRKKVFLLGQFSSSSSPEIADPYDGTLQDFQHYLKVIKESCDRLIMEIHSAGDGRRQ